MSQSGQSESKRRTPWLISPQGLRGKGLPTSAAMAGGTRGMRKLDSAPSTAMPSSTKPMCARFDCQVVNRMLPMVAPRMMARNVLISMTPLTRDRAVDGTISGRMPYFAGLKSADCSDMRNSTVSMSGMFSVQNARQPSAMAPISRSLVAMSTRRLLCTSAKWPA